MNFETGKSSDQGRDGQPSEIILQASEYFEGDICAVTRNYGIKPQEGEEISVKDHGETINCMIVQVGDAGGKGRYDIMLKRNVKKQS